MPTISEVDVCPCKYQDDGYCDDENNFSGCAWDGGDCCGNNINTKYCTKCECLDPNYSSPTTCINEYDDWKCENYKNDGDCNNQYKEWMVKYCKKTCGKC